MYILSFFFQGDQNMGARETTPLMKREVLYSALFLFILLKRRAAVKRESDFQTKLANEITKMFPGSLVYKNESYIQGFPDLTVLYNDKWAMLECKRSKKAIHQPNQDTYIDILNEMSFAAVVYPENKEDVLNALKQKFL